MFGERNEQYHMCPRHGGGWAVTEAALARKVAAVARSAEFVRVSVDGGQAWVRFVFVGDDGFVEVPRPPFADGATADDIDAPWVRVAETAGWVATWTIDHECFVPMELYWPWVGDDDHRYHHAASIAAAALRGFHGATEEEWWTVEVRFPAFCASSRLVEPRDLAGTPDPARFPQPLGDPKAWCIVGV